LQNLVYTFDSAENAAATIIKQEEEYENAQMVANSPMQTTSSTTLNMNDENGGDELNGLQFYDNAELIEKIELDEENGGRSISIEMDLDENGAR